MAALGPAGRRTTVEELRSHAESVARHALETRQEVRSTSSSPTKATAERRAQSGRIIADVSDVTCTSTSTPCRKYQDITFPNPQQAKTLSFQNHYVASITVIRKRVANAGGVDAGATWDRVMTDFPLMPDCHRSDGAMNSFVIPLQGEGELIPPYAGLRVYLNQPSPCWQHMDVKLDEVAVYTSSASIESIRESMHILALTGSREKKRFAVAADPSAAALLPAVVPVDMMAAVEGQAAEADHTKAMCTLTMALHDTIHAWRAAQQQQQQGLAAPGDVLPEQDEVVGITVDAADSGGRSLAC